MTKIIIDNVRQVKKYIADAAKCSGRDANAITLVAVSKTQPIAVIREAIAAGQYQFGENYVQEGIKKIQYFQQIAASPPLIWHFIGSLQSNKSRLVAEYYDWVHTIDRLTIAKRLSVQRATTKPPLNVLIQINISDENNKSGINPEHLFDLAKNISPLPNLQLRGVMAIPAITSDKQQQLSIFKKMFTLYTQLKTRYPHIDTLSIGMSSDMSAAILAGSTLVRIGTAIFGSKNPVAK